MAKYIYPAVFQPEGKQFCITYPDIPNCFTQGENLADALDNAQDALCLMLYHMEKDGREIPEPSAPKSIEISGEQFVTLISCDTLEYEKFYKNKSVKKTLTIPEWLNDMALKENINFSNVLQNALMEQLHI